MVARESVGRVPGKNVTFPREAVERLEEISVCPDHLLMAAPKAARFPAGVSVLWRYCLALHLPSPKCPAYRIQANENNSGCFL